MTVEEIKKNPTRGRASDHIGLFTHPLAYLDGDDVIPVSCCPLKCWEVWFLGLFMVVLLNNTLFSLSLSNHFMVCCQIRSDKDKQTAVEYYLRGSGANKHPVNLFVVDHDTGFVRITGVVDREKYPSFNVRKCLQLCLVLSFFSLFEDTFSS